MLIDQQVVATWTGMETFWTGSSAVFGGNSLVFVGTAADETVYAQVAGQVRATFGAGDDSFLADQVPRAGSVIAGGDGRDLLYVTSRAGLLDLDLRSGRMRASAGAPYTFSATEFEDASLFAQRVVIGGTDSRNELSFSACDANVRGRGGADTIARYYDSLYETVFCPRYPKARLDGGSGRDDITGTIGKDVLIGGKSGPDELKGADGNDILRGGGGSDRLLGGKGRDSLQGQAGQDRLYGGPSRYDADGGPSPQGPVPRRAENRDASADAPLSAPWCRPKAVPALQWRHKVDLIGSCGQTGRTSRGLVWWVRLFRESS